MGFHKHVSPVPLFADFFRCHQLISQDMAIEFLQYLLASSCSIGIPVPSVKMTSSSSHRKETSAVGNPAPCPFTIYLTTQRAKNVSFLSGALQQHTKRGPILRRICLTAYFPPKLKCICGNPGHGPLSPTQSHLKPEWA